MYQLIVFYFKAIAEKIILKNDRNQTVIFKTYSNI